MSSRVASLGMVAFVVGALVVGRVVRGELGLELSPGSVQSYVLGLGFIAPVVYVALVTFRSVLLIPSMILLTAGGLVFGAFAGTVLGSIGILISAVLILVLARGIGRSWIRPHLGEGFTRFERRLESAGLILVCLATAHPFGPMSPSHWAAGFSSLAWAPYLAAIAIAGLIRSFAYSYFGANLLAPGSPGFWVSTGVLLVIALVPLVHPGLRRRILGQEPAALR